MARSWVGLTILACLPCTVVFSSILAAHYYEKKKICPLYYQYAASSSPFLFQTRALAQLSRKGLFPYESILAHAITWSGMHVHAVLSLQEARIRSMTKERISRWPHRLDV